MKAKFRKSPFFCLIVLFLIFTNISFSQYIKIDSLASGIIIHPVYDSLNMYASNCYNKPCSSDLDIDNNGVVDVKIKMNSSVGGFGSWVDLFI